MSISQASKENKYTKDCILGCCEHTRKDKLFYKDSYWVYKYEYENDNFSWENYLNGIWSCENKIKDKHTKRNRKIIQYSLNREVVNIWETFKDIEQAGFTRNQVLDICNHRKKTRKTIRDIYGLMKIMIFLMDILIISKKIYVFNDKKDETGIGNR